MIYVIYAFGGLFVVLCFAMLFVSYRERHVGMFIMGVTYGISGLLAIMQPHWWPIVMGFALVWLLRFMGLEPRVESRDEGGGVSREFEGGACAPPSRRTPDAMQRDGPGSQTRDEGKRDEVTK